MFARTRMSLGSQHLFGTGPMNDLAIPSGSSKSSLVGCTGEISDGSNALMHSCFRTSVHMKLMNDTTITTISQ